FLSFFTSPPSTSVYTLSLHDALPIYAGHADRVEPAAGKNRRRFWTGAVARGGALHRERCRVGGLPQDFSGCGVERAHHLVLLLSREHVDAISSDERRGVAGADGNLPTLGQALRPRGGLT